MESRAAISVGAGTSFVLDDIELAEPGPGEALVEIHAAGVCHTDITFALDPTRFPRPGILGHEGAGVVLAVGPDVGSFRPGDRVVLTFPSCGSCEACRDARPAHCPRRRTLSYSGVSPGTGHTRARWRGEDVHGFFFGQSSFSTVALVNHRVLVRIPDEVPFPLAAPFACAFQTGAGTVLNSLHPRAGDSLGVWGVGSVGIAAIFAAAVSGVHPLWAVDVSETRLEIARRAGASHIAIAGEGVESALREVHPDGLDYAVDTTGIPSVTLRALGAVRPGGVCVTLGVPLGDQPIAVSPLTLVAGRTLRGVNEGDSNPTVFIPRLIRLFTDKGFPFDDVLSFFPFESINEAFASMQRQETMKPVLLSSFGDR